MDRKARIREYKETPRPAGLFVVRNLTTGKSLVGASTNLPGSINRQRFQLELGSHPDRELQREWNEQGPEAFVIEALDKIDSSDDSAYDPSSDLEVLRSEWLEKLVSSGCPLYPSSQERTK